MTDFVVFETKGLMDERAFTMFGVNSKPNTDSPIGYFGTGLKYAIAVLMREGAEVIIDIGYFRWTFEKKESEFRGKTITEIEAQNGYGKKLILPYTTDLGKNWEIWQAYREIASNTKDEKGTVGRALLGERDDDVTRVWVRHPEFVKLQSTVGSVFIDDGLIELFSGEDVRILSGQSNHLYYRGIRIMDLPRPSKYTYDIVRNLRLTEDRTPESEHHAKSIVSGAIMQLEDADLIRNIVTTGDDCYYEGVLDFEAYRSFSSEFCKVVRDLVGGDGYVMARVKTFFNRYMLSKSEKRSVLISLQEDQWKAIWELCGDRVDSSDAVRALRNQLNMEQVNVEEGKALPGNVG